MKLLTAILAGLAVIFGIIPDCDGAVKLDKDKYDFDDLLNAISVVESDGDPNAINKKENAMGLFQIRPIYLRDVNRILGYQAFKLNDRFDPQKSRCMVSIYLRHYGRGKTLEQMARQHNGGPRGDKKKSTKAYWLKVKKVMEAKQ